MAHSDNSYWQPSLSRRRFLQGTTITVGSVAALMGATLPAQAKMEQKAAGYVDKTAKNDQNCANCALFKAPSSCTLVDGAISPDGWCRFYSKKS